MTAPETTTSAPGSRSLNWIALILLVVAIIFNLLRIRNGGHTGYASWTLLAGLLCSTASNYVTDRAARRILTGLTMLLLIVAIYGMLNGGF